MGGGRLDSEKGDKPGIREERLTGVFVARQRPNNNSISKLDMRIPANPNITYEYP